VAVGDVGGEHGERLVRERGSTPKNVAVTIGTAWSTPAGRAAARQLLGERARAAHLERGRARRSSIASVKEARTLRLMTPMATTSATPHATPAAVSAHVPVTPQMAAGQRASGASAPEYGGARRLAPGRACLLRDRRWRWPA
jgi:hypothetical protein